MLFTGDIEECAQTEIFKRYGTKIHVDAYKVAHHGSRKYYKKFIDAVRPKVAVSSGIYVWDFQIDALYFSSRDLIRDLKSLGAKVYHTANHRNIQTRSDGKHFIVKPFPSFRSESVF